MKRNTRILALGVFLLSILMLISWGIRTERLDKRFSMPDFEFQDVNGRLVSRENLLGHEGLFFLMKHVNSFNYSLIQRIKRQVAGKEQVTFIAIFDTCDAALLDSLRQVNANNVRFVQQTPIGRVTESFRVQEMKEEAVLWYNSSGRLRAWLDPRRDFLRINSMYPDGPSSHLTSETQALRQSLEELYSMYPDGIYYLSDSHCASCEVVGVFEHLQELTIRKALPMELHLLGKWSRTEINNLRREQIIRVNINRADVAIEKVVDVWKNKSNNKSLTMIIAKSDTFIQAFPILTTSDVDVFFKHEESLVAMLQSN